MNNTKTIAVDVMGESPEITMYLVTALARISQDTPDLRFIAVGDSEQIKLPEKGFPNLEVLHCADYIGMEEKLTARDILSRQDSSIAQAVNLVRTGAADAVLSSGNSAVYLATLRTMLKVIPGFTGNPFLASPAPSGKADTQSLWLDVGAHADPTAKNFLQMHMIGRAVMQALGVLEPRVGLLNMGVEESKGNPLYKEARTLLHDLPGFIGNVEGTRLYSGSFDVLLMCAQVGNALIKSQKGLIGWQLRYLQVRADQAATPQERAETRVALEGYQRMMAPFLNNSGGALILGTGGLAAKVNGSTSYAETHFTLGLLVKLVKADFFSTLKGLLAENQ